MKTLTKILAATAFAIGCAGSDFDYSEQEEVGQTDQELMSGYMGSLQFGFRPTTEVTCVVNNTSQICIVPREKAVRFSITGGSAVQRDIVRAQVNGWYAGMVNAGMGQTLQDWLFSEAGSVSDQYLTLLIDVDTGSGFCTGVGIDTQDYSCFSGSRANLTESSGIDGNYQRWVGVPVLHIDYDEIQAISGLTATQKSNVVRQAVWSGLLRFTVWSGLLRFTGNGLVTVGDNRCSKATLTSAAPCFITTAQACAANSFGDTGNQVDWWFAGAECGQ
jgi:hypothetical protein